MIIVFLLFGIFSAIGYHYGYKQCEEDKIESNPRYFNEKIELEKAIATCNNENKHLDRVYKEYETKLAECVNDLKVSKENELSVTVQYTECYVASELCHNENQNINKKTVKCEANRDQCERDGDRLRVEHKGLEVDFTECHKARLKQIEDEKATFNNENNHLDKVYKEYETKQAECVNGLKVLKEKELSAIKENGELKDLVSKCEEKRDQCEQDGDRLRDEYKGLELDFTEYRKECVKQKEDEKVQCEMQYKKSLDICSINCEKSKFKCAELYSNCQDDLKKSQDDLKKKWL